MSRRRKSTTMNKDFIKKYDMLPPKSRVLCAVSGGKDSMYLLCRMLELRESLDITVLCAHFDHQLRGGQSDRDREFVKSFCSAREIPCFVGCGSVSGFAEKNGMGTEEAARVLRYDFLEKTALEADADRIATAHTADDNAETMLLNLTRGAGLRGLCGIPPVRGKIIRPMLDVTTEEVLQYLRERGIDHVEDETNASDDYSRNRLRHAVIPELRMLNPGFAQSLFRTAESLREDEAYFSALSSDFLQKNLKNDEISAALFSDLPRPVSARVLRMLCGTSLTFEHAQSIRAIAAGESGSAAVDIPGMRVRRDYDRLCFGKTQVCPLPRRTVRIGAETELSEAKLTIRTEKIEKCSEIHNSVNTFFFKSDSICGNIICESRRDGEKIRISGRNCTKTLKKLFSEHRLNGIDKNLVPVLYDSAGPIAVYGIGMAERCAAKAGDEVIKIEMIPSTPPE